MLRKKFIFTEEPFLVFLPPQYTAIQWYHLSAGFVHSPFSNSACPTAIFFESTVTGQLKFQACDIFQRRLSAFWIPLLCNVLAILILKCLKELFFIIKEATLQTVQKKKDAQQRPRGKFHAHTITPCITGAYRSSLSFMPTSHWRQNMTFCQYITQLFSGKTATLKIRNPDFQREDAKQFMYRTTNHRALINTNWTATCMNRKDWLTLVSLIWAFFLSLPKVNGLWNNTAVF